MKVQGWGALRVVGLWTSLMVLTGIATLLGFLAAVFVGTLGGTH